MVKYAGKEVADVRPCEHIWDMFKCIFHHADPISLWLFMHVSFLNNIFQFYMIWFQALKLKVEDPEVYRQKAEELSKKFGDKFTEGYNTKLQEILYGSW